MRSFALVAILTSTALAEPAAKLLDKGRKLEQQGKHAEAIAAYEEYLKAAPDDPVANGELGFAALQAKDLDKAEKATRLAIAHAQVGSFHGDKAGRPRGAALFNLGMIQEAQNKPQDAAVSYGESLNARSSRVAREKLQKLDATLAAQLDPLAPTRLAGPFKTIKDLCRDWHKKTGGTGDETWGESSSCNKVDGIELAKGSAKLAAPFEDIQAFEMDDRSSLEIAVKLKEGWFHFEYPGKGHRSPAHCGGTLFTVKPIGVSKRVATELRIDYTSRGACDHRDHSWDWAEVGSIVIGVGASNRPSGMLVVSKLKETETADGGKKPFIEGDATLSLAWNKDGTLDVSGKIPTASTNGVMQFQPGDVDSDDYLGHHVLVFP
jgi:hypothetical protein